MSDAERKIAEFRGTYSPDVEVGADDTIRATRDIAEGDVISVPMHMFHKIRTDDRVDGYGQAKTKPHFIRGFE